MDIVKYIGIPYDIKNNNCYTLVRDFARNELGLMVPDYMFNVDNYHDEAEDILNQTRHCLGKGWEVTDKLELGTVVTFRVLGRESHIGICINDREFLHNFKGRNSGIDNLKSGEWCTRLKGRFKWINS